MYKRTLFGNKKEKKMSSLMDEYLAAFSSQDPSGKGKIPPAAIVEAVKNIRGSHLKYVVGLDRVVIDELRATREEELREPGDSIDELVDFALFVRLVERTEIMLKKGKFEINEEGQNQPPAYFNIEENPGSSPSYFQSRTNKVRLYIISGVFCFIVCGLILALGLAFGLKQTIIVQVTGTNPTFQEYIIDMAADFNSLNYRTSKGVIIEVLVITNVDPAFGYFNPFFAPSYSFSEFFPPIPGTIPDFFFGVSTFFSSYAATVWIPNSLCEVNNFVQNESTTLWINDINTDCTVLTQVPLGFATWQPLASETVLDWSTIISYLEANKTDYFIAHANPVSSTVGMLALLSAIYDITKSDPTQPLSNSTLWNTTVLNQIQLLESSMYHYSNQDENLLDFMISQGEGYYTLVATDETHVIAANLGYYLGYETTDPNPLFYPQLSFLYPSKAMFLEHPYCILQSVQGVSDLTPYQDAAQVFLNFLLSDISRISMVSHGIRPANQTQVDLTNSDYSPFSEINGVSTFIPPGVMSLPTKQPPEILLEMGNLWLQTKKPGYILLLLDVSSGLGSDLSILLSLATTFVSDLAPGNFIMAMTFASEITNLTTAGVASEQVKTELNREISGLSTDSSQEVRLYDALNYGNSYLTALRNHDVLVNNGLPFWNYNLVIMTKGVDDGSSITVEDLSLIFPIGTNPDQLHLYSVTVNSQVSRSQYTLDKLCFRTVGISFYQNGDSVSDLAQALADMF